MPHQTIRTTRQWRHAVLLAMLTATTACGADGSTAPTPAPAPAPAPSPTPSPTPAPAPTPTPSVGVVSGSVTDTQGRPIAGATIVINNAVWFNRNIVLTSGADGSYRYDMPATDSWYVRGTTTVTRSGRTYTLDLKPDYAGAFSGRDGRVVNLTWALTGAVPTEFGHSGFYGGSVEMDTGWDLSDLAGIVLTLTPVGTLLDGSAGAVITASVPDARSTFVLRDVPMGRYTVQATRNGAPLRFRVRHTSDYVASLTTDFDAAYTGATSYGIYFSVATQPMP